MQVILSKGDFLMQAVEVLQADDSSLMS